MQEVIQALKDRLNRVASDFFNDQIGAVIGQTTTLRALKMPIENPEARFLYTPLFGYLPSSIKMDTKFEITKVTFDSDGNSSDARLCLWVAPITKKGVPSLNDIRLLQIKM